MRVMVVGTGSPSADLVAQVLNSNGISATWVSRVGTPNLRLIRKFDVVYGIYLQTSSRYILAGKLLGKQTIVHFVGSDEYRVMRERTLVKQMFWRTVLRCTDAVLYVSPHLEPMVGREGYILPFPIRTDEFKRPELLSISPERDILYYCPSGRINERIYRLDWIIEYAKTHPHETITVVGSIAHPAAYRLELTNVRIIPSVEPDQMPFLYRKHRKLVRMTTEDGLPRMMHEALLCGLKVEFNGKAVKEIPPETRTI